MAKSPSKNARPPQKRVAHGHFASDKSNLPHVGLHAHPDIERRLVAIELQAKLSEKRVHAYGALLEGQIRAMVEDRLTEHDTDGLKAPHKAPTKQDRKEHRDIAWMLAFVALLAAAGVGAWYFGWFAVAP